MPEQAPSDLSRLPAGKMTLRHWLGFIALCVLGASAWLVEGAWPSLMPAASRDCLHFLVVALAVGIIGWRKIARSKFRSTPVAKLAAASVCLLAIPAALVEQARSGVSEATIAALFALLPTAIVLLMLHFDVGEWVHPATTSLLAPALIGLAGTLLLLPFAMPASFREARLYAFVVLAVLIAGAASVWMYRLLVEVGVVEALVIWCSANAILLLAVSLVLSAIDGSSWIAQWTWDAVRVEAVKAILLNLPQIGLLLWLMKFVAPERLAARAFVVPLLTVMEGYALVRPELSVRSLCGAALLIYGASRLLTSKQHDEEPGLMLR